MPIVRGIARDAAKQDYRFSAIVLGHRQERAVPDEEGGADVHGTSHELT